MKCITSAAASLFARFQNSASLAEGLILEIGQFRQCMRDEGAGKTVQVVALHVGLCNLPLSGIGSRHDIVAVGGNGRDEGLVFGEVLGPNRVLPVVDDHIPLFFYFISVSYGE